MAAPNHQLYTPEQASRSVLAATRYQSTLARLVSTDYSTEFVAGRGATVTIKRPVMIDKARVYTQQNRLAEDAITYSDLYQPYTSITITDQVYNAVKLPDDFTTFTLESLEQQVVAPMAESVAEQLNNTIVKALGTVEAGINDTFDVSAGTQNRYVGANGTRYADMAALRAAGTTFAGFANTVSVTSEQLTATTRGEVLGAIRSAHQLLGQRGVPQTGRVLAVGANWEAALLGLDNLNKVNQAGDNSVLRMATLGQLYGFTIVVDYSLGANDAYAFQRDAVTLVTRTTAIPRGASFAATTSAEGFTMRYLQDYDPDHLTDRAVVDTFAGAEVLDPQRIVRLTGADSMVEDAAAPAAPNPEG